MRLLWSLVALQGIACNAIFGIGEVPTAATTSNPRPAHNAADAADFGGDRDSGTSMVLPLATGASAKPSAGSSHSAPPVTTIDADGVDADVVDSGTLDAGAPEAGPLDAAAVGTPPDSDAEVDGAESDGSK